MAGDDPLARLEIGLCWGTLERASLTELIEAAARHGFPTLSLRPDTIAAGVDQLGEAGLRRRLADAGVRVRVIDALAGGLPGMEAVTAAAHAAGKPPPPDEQACLRAAETVAAPIVNVSLWGGAPAPLDALAAAIAGVARRAAARGIAIVLEFVPGTTIPDIGFARDIVAACAAPGCAVLLDPWHLARSGGTLADVAALPPGTIGALQLDDRTEPPPGTPYVPMTGRDLPGEGELPLHALARAALANNPALTAEVEVFSAELRDLPIDAAAARVARAVAAWRSAAMQDRP